MTLGKSKLVALDDANEKCKASNQPNQLSALCPSTRPFTTRSTCNGIQSAVPRTDNSGPQRMSTPKQKCVGWPEQKYIGDAGRKAPNWGPFLRASGLGRIIHRGVSTGAA